MGLVLSSTPGLEEGMCCHDPQANNIGALTIGLGVYYTILFHTILIMRNPSNSVLIVKAPVLNLYIKEPYSKY